jgi:glutaminyl-tRNA synthetase
MRRRGFTPASIRNFCESIGVGRSDSVVDMAMLEHAIRVDLDKIVPRAMCVLNPLKVVLSNIEAGHVELLSMANHPKDEAMGRRQVSLTRDIVIDQADFEEQAPAGFKRLRPGAEVRLRGAYVIRCDEVVKDDDGKVIELVCSVDKATLGKKPEGRKVKGVVHWVSADFGVPVSVRLYDRLFNVENPEAKDVANYRACLNPDSIVELSDCMLEAAAVGKSAASSFQFEREGYFCLDIADSRAGKPVFNRTITLRDSWSS